MFDITKTHNHLYFNRRDLASPKRYAKASAEVAEVKPNLFFLLLKHL